MAQMKYKGRINKAAGKNDSTDLLNAEEKAGIYEQVSHERTSTTGKGKVSGSPI